MAVLDNLFNTFLRALYVFRFDIRSSDVAKAMSDKSAFGG
jgi:hypothetical protein